MIRPPQDDIEEMEEEAAANYVNAPARTGKKMAARPDQRSRCFSQSFLPIAVCWLILLVIMGLRIYFTNRNLNDSVFEKPITNLTALNQELETQNQELESRNQDLETRNQELKTRNQELETRNRELETQNQELETRNQELETRNQELETRNQELETRNQELERERKNIKGPIPDISRAQWSIDEYCPKVKNERRCRPCQKGWELFRSRCYLINDPSDRKTWEEAREDCRARSSDLVVVHDEAERDELSRHSRTRPWIGLRAEGGRWKWIDGRDLTESDRRWIQGHPPTDGRCVISDPFRWTSASCVTRSPWICQKKSLSV